MDRKPSAAQLEWAARLLEGEGASGGAAECAQAAGRVYDKIHAHLDPLLGVSGVQALLARSASLTQSELACLADIRADRSSQKLIECLQAQEAAVAITSAAALFGTFFGLLTTFIGERLTTQVLRSAFPALEETLPEEKK